MSTPMEYCFDSFLLPSCKESSDAAEKYSFLPESIGYSVAFDIMITSDIFIFIWLGYHTIRIKCVYIGKLI